MASFLLQWNGWDTTTEEVWKIKESVLNAKAAVGNGVFRSKRECLVVLSRVCFRGGEAQYLAFFEKWINVYPGITRMKDDKHGFLLFRAVLSETPLLIELLVKKGADLSMQSTGGHDALFIACATGRRSCISLLLKLGADPNTVNGKTQQTLMAFVADAFGRHGFGDWRKAWAQTPAFVHYQQNIHYKIHCLDYNAGDVLIELIKNKGDLLAELPCSRIARKNGRLKGKNTRAISALDLLRGPRLWPSWVLSHVVDRVVEEWEMGPHPSQRWRRRGAFMQFAAEIGLRPLAARRKKLEDNMLPTDARIPKVEGERRDIVRDRALSDLFIFKRIMSYL